MSTTHPTADPLRQRRAVIACVAGNFMEYYDFAIFGFFAVAIGSAFFPEGSDTAALLQALAVFGVAFLVRPLGGVMFGQIGDRLGRRTALVVSVLLMSGATAIMGLLPTYASIGVLAPVLLVLLRCAQGLSVGGEWGASSAFLIETAPKGRRGIFGSLPSMSAALGLIAGSLLALLLNGVLGEEAVAAWGWRIPFLIAAPLGLLALWMRLKLAESPVDEVRLEDADRPKARVRDAVARERLPSFGVTFAFSWICGVGLFYLGSYVVTFLGTVSDLPATRAALLTALGLAVYASLCPVAGRLSDRFGRRRTLLFGCAGHAILGMPMFYLLGTGSTVAILVALLMFAVVQAPINANTSLVMIELFPASTRLTNGALAFNLGVGPPSGFGPLVAAALVAATGLTVAPAFFLSGVAVVCGLVLLRWLPETAGRDLTTEEAPTAGRAAVAQSRVTRDA